MGLQWWDANVSRQSHVRASEGLLGDNRRQQARCASRNRTKRASNATKPSALKQRRVKKLSKWVLKMGFGLGFIMLPEKGGPVNSRHRCYVRDRSPEYRRDETNFTKPTSIYRANFDDTALVFPQSYQFSNWTTATRLKSLAQLTVVCVGREKI